MYVHMGLMHGAVQQERTQHCEAIMLKNETAMGVSRGGKRKSKGGRGRAYMHFLKTDMSESACRQGSLPATVAPKVPGYILPASRCKTSRCFIHSLSCV